MRRRSHTRVPSWSQQALPTMTQVNMPTGCQPAAGTVTPAATPAHLRSAQKSPWLVSTRTRTQEKEGNEWEEKEESRGEDGGGGRGNKPQPCRVLHWGLGGRLGERGAPLPGFSAHGTLQARMLEWVAIPFSRGSSPPSNPDPCFPRALDLKEATSISDKLHK